MITGKWQWNVISCCTFILEWQRWQEHEILQHIRTRKPYYSIKSITFYSSKHFHFPKFLDVKRKGTSQLYYSIALDISRNPSIKFKFIFTYTVFPKLCHRKRLNYLTSSRIFSARRSILKILPTTGAKLLCHSISCILSNSIPSSMSMAAIFAALKHNELMDCNPLHLRYSWMPRNDTSDPYNSAISLRPLWKVKQVPSEWICTLEYSL